MTSGSTAGPASPWFVTTHWSVVTRAQAYPPPAAAAALDALCQTYWPPLYNFARRLGHSREEAEDLTQEFFARLLAHHYLEAADPEKGKFRTFLLMAFKRFLANEWDRERALKRGGGHKPVPLDTSLAEAFVGSSAGVDPERAYDRRWALLILERAMDALQCHWQSTTGDFNLLKPCLVEDKQSLDYSRLAARLGVSEGAARVAVHRFRKAFRESFKTEVAQTLSNPEDLDAEIRHLLSVLGG